MKALLARNRLVLPAAKASIQRFAHGSRWCAVTPDRQARLFGQYPAAGSDAAGFEWWLHARIYLERIPEGEGFQVSEISCGLSFANGEGGACNVVRYDWDPTRESDAAHINVRQPGALKDKVHYPVFAAWDGADFPLEQVLDFLLGDELKAKVSRLTGAQMRGMLT